MFVLKGRKISLNAVAFSPDGGRLAAAGERGIVQVWDLAEKKIERRIVIGLFTKEAVFFAGKELLVLHEDRVDAFNLASGKQTRQLPPRNRRLAQQAALRPDGERLAVAFPGAVVEMRVSDAVTQWETRPGVFRLSKSLAYSGDGKTLAVGMSFGAVLLLDARTGERCGTLSPNTMTEVRGVALSPNGSHVAGCLATTLYLWQPGHHQEEVARHSLGKTHFLAVSWHPSGDFFATANGDGKIDFWNTSDGQRRESFDWGVGKLNDVIFDATGDRAACCSKTGEIVIWDVDR